MKFNKLLILATAFVLGLNACNSSKKTNHSDSDSFDSESGINESESGNESESASDSEEEPGEDIAPYYVNGTSDGFPTSVIEAYQEHYRRVRLIIPYLEDQTWKYEAYITTDNYAYLDLTIADPGTPGTDAYEDLFTQYILSLGVDVYAWEYDTRGYVVSDTNYWDDSFSFITQNGVFTIRFFGPQIKQQTFDSFPSDYVRDYLSMIKSEANIPSPVSQHPWKASIYKIGNRHYFKASTIDENAPYVGHKGKNSIEDAYKKVLSDDNWSIDSSDYDNNGYYANKGKIELNFWSWDGYFFLWIN